MPWRCNCARGAWRPTRIWPAPCTRRQSTTRRWPRSAAIALKPRTAGAQVAVGYALEEVGKRDDAIAAYREAIKIAPGDAQALKYLGSAAFARRQARRGDRSSPRGDQARTRGRRSPDHLRLRTLGSRQAGRSSRQLQGCDQAQIRQCSGSLVPGKRLVKTRKV